MKGLIATIYKDHNDCSLQGISSRCEFVTVVGLPDGEIFEADDKAPAVKIVKRVFAGVPYFHVEPVESGQWAFGGTIVDCCDSRFREVVEYPLRFHDRDLSKEV